jgi:hypothetical protein
VSILGRLSLLASGCCASAFSKRDAEIRIVGGGDRHTADAEIFSMGGGDRPEEEIHTSSQAKRPNKMLYAYNVVIVKFETLIICLPIVDPLLRAASRLPNLSRCAVISKSEQKS